MSVKKVREVDSIYSGGSTKRSRILDNISCSSNATGRWTSILSCCWKRKRERKLSLKEYDPNEFDYIVEKLVLKRVPLALYATEEDFQEFTEAKSHKETSHGPSMGPATVAREMRDKQIYSVWPEMDSSFYFLRHKTRENVANRPSNKNLRFNKDEDMLDEDAMEAGPSNYRRRVSSRARDNELKNAFLNRFSALHPDLKESELPPKDPDPLNPPRSKRSLAESISEIASAKKVADVKSKRERDKIKRGANVYVTVSDTSKEISTVLGDEETPTRDKYIAKNTHSAFCRKMCSTSCTSCPQKCSKLDELKKVEKVELAEGRQLNREIKSPHNRHKLLAKFKNKDSNNESTLKGSQQLIAHYVSPEQYSANKLADFNLSKNDAGLMNQRRRLSELSKPPDADSTTDKTSLTSNELKTKNSTGTTLRWKIIIKHHQPTPSQTASESTSDPRIRSAVENESFSRHKGIAATSESLDKIEIDDEINNGI